MNNGLSQQVLHRPKAELVFRSSVVFCLNNFWRQTYQRRATLVPAKYLTFKNGAKLQPKTVSPACNLIGILEGVGHVQPKKGGGVKIRIHRTILSSLSIASFFYMNFKVLTLQMEKKISAL